jgi:hypothetical protein
MSDIIAYHSARVMGHEFRPPKDGHFYWWSGKSEHFLTAAIGNRVWAVSGRLDGKRTVYSLRGVFTLSEVRPDGGGFALLGDGTLFTPPFELTEQRWFLDLRREQANFSLGFSRIRSESTVTELERLLAEYAKTKTLHILVAESEAVERVEGAASSGRNIRWVVPKSAAPGDEAILFFRPRGFLGRAQVLSRPVPAMFGKKHVFSSMIGRITLFSPPVPLVPASEKFPDWGWPKYPKGCTSVISPLCNHLLRFLTSYRVGSVRGGAVVEGIAREARVLRRSRNRALRQEALRQAAGVCAACGVKYSKLLGGRGECVLQVHHRRQLALRRTPRKTTIGDLAVLCANCHSIIHADPETAIPVEQLQASWRREERDQTRGLGS